MMKLRLREVKNLNLYLCSEPHLLSPAQGHTPATVPLFPTSSILSYHLCNPYSIRGCHNTSPKFNKSRALLPRAAPASSSFLCCPVQHSSSFTRAARPSVRATPSTMAVPSSGQRPFCSHLLLHQIIYTGAITSGTQQMTY